MATDSRGHAPGDELQTDIPSRRLIIAGDDDPLEDRGAPEISVDRGFKSLRPHFTAASNGRERLYCARSEDLHPENER